MPRNGFSAHRNVHTRASHTEERFFVADGPRPSNGTRSVHIQLDVYDSTGNIRIVPAIQESDEIDIWPQASTCTPVNSLVATGDGVSGSDAYTTVNLTKSFWRPGVQVRNNTDTNLRIEHALVSTRFDIRST